MYGIHCDEAIAIMSLILFFYSVSLELLVQDVKQIQKGFENAKNELIHEKNNAKVKVCYNTRVC